MKKLPMLSPFIALLCLGLIGGSQWLSDQSSRSFQDSKKKAAFALSTPLLPSLSALKILSFGNPSLMADILWIQTIQYFGSGSPYGNYPALGSLLTTITTLDPKFEYPYEFGLVVLPFMNQTDAAIKMGEQAQYFIPNNGLLTYYLATDYHLNKKDFQKASFYYQKASKQPGAPGAALSLAGISLAKINTTLNDRLVALTFWKTVYENTKNDDQRAEAKKWFEHLSIVFQIEKAAIDYQTQFGHYPNSIQSLVDSHYLPEIPVSPTGRALVLDPQTGKVSFDHLLPQK